MNGQPRCAPGLCRLLDEKEGPNRHNREGGVVNDEGSKGTPTQSQRYRGNQEEPEPALWPEPRVPPGILEGKQQEKHGHQANPDKADFAIPEIRPRLRRDDQREGGTEYPDSSSDHPS